VTIETDERTLGAGELEIVELIPKQPLPAKTKHEVVVTAAGKDTVLGEFTTGDGADEKEPTWNGILRATFVRAAAVCCNCTTGDPYAVLALGEVSDDHTSASSLQYAIFAPDAQGSYDYDAAPLTYVRAWGTGSRSATSRRARPRTSSSTRRRAAARLGARGRPRGRYGKASEVELDVAHPAKKAP